MFSYYLPVLLRFEIPFLNTEIKENITTLYSRIDNIELGYLSATPTSAEPHYYPVCECGRGYTGEQCEQCATGFSRSPETGLCDRPCQCNGNSEICDEQGICLVSRGFYFLTLPDFR